MHRILSISVLAVIAASASNAQDPLTNRPVETPSSRPDDSLVITVKIVLEDGSRLTTTPLISLLQGGFCHIKDSFGSGVMRLAIASPFVDNRQDKCFVAVMLAGYHTSQGWVGDGSLITMKRLGPNEGSTISLTTLSAPPAAVKSYNAGEAAANKRKWQNAEQSFQKAVAAYPLYATAWSELGRALQEQGRFDAAAVALNQARKVDPKYIKPLVQLADLARAQQHWEQELSFSTDALALHPVDFPLAYFYHAEAAYRLGHFDDAEHFAREAFQMDVNLENPDTLFLLANIFQAKGATEDAITQYKTYLRIAPHGANADRAKQQLAALRVQ